MKNLVVSLIYSIAVITPLLAQPPVTVYAQASKQSSFLKLTAEDYYVYSTSFLLSRIDGIDTLDGLTQAIHLDPNFAEAYYARSIWQKTEKLSIQDLTQAIRVNPNFADAYYKRGLLYYKSGNTKAALEDINYAIFASALKMTVSTSCEHVLKTLWEIKRRQQRII